MTGDKLDTTPIKPAQRFLSLAFASADLLFEIGMTGKIIFAIGATVGLTERTEAELIGGDWLAIVDMADHENLRTQVMGMAVGTRYGPCQVQLALPRGDGTARYAFFSACRLPGTEDRISCALTHLRQPLSLRSTPLRHDVESGLLDSESFINVATDIALASKSTTYPIEIVLVDVHGLANDPTDEIASALIKKISGLLRTASIDGDSVGRLAYNKFGLLHEPGNNILFEKIADIRHEGANAGLNLSCVQQNIAVDIGNLTNDDLVKAIKYTVNKFVTSMPGENTSVKVLSETFETMVSNTLKRMDDFIINVREQKFELWFQPIIDMELNSLHHFEILVRFQEGESPFEDIRFAEQIGVIEQFDLAVCSRAIELLKSKNNNGSLVAVAINISGKSIENSIFVECLLKILKENKFLSKWLSIEITESSRMRDLIRAEHIIQKIRQLGYIVCLDDFGAGSASFQYLRALTVDFVKIDGIYVKQIGQSHRDDAMLRCIAGTCTELGIGTIGECVETAAQAASLMALGVKFAQGWHYGRPTPEALWTPPSGLSASLQATEIRAAFAKAGPPRRVHTKPVN